MSEQTAPVVDPYAEPTTLAADIAAAVEIADPIAPRLARAREVLAVAEIALAEAEEKFAAERDVQGQNQTKAATHAATAAAIDLELRTCDMDSVEALVKKRATALSNHQVFEDRAAALQPRLDAARTARDAAEDNVDRARLALRRAELDALDAEAVALARKAAEVMGDIFERLAATARDASNIAHGIEFRRLGEPPQSGSDISTVILKKAEWAEPRGSANVLHKAAAILLYVDVEMPRDEFERAETRRRAEAPPPTAPLPQGARHPLFGVKDGPSGGVRDVNIGRVSVAD